MAKLTQHGIYARPEEWSPLGKSVTDLRILVRHGDVAAAEALTERL